MITSKKNMSKIIKGLLYIILIIAMFDVLMFLWWSQSGQPCPEGFYFGKLTAEVLRLIIR